MGIVDIFVTQIGDLFRVVLMLAVLVTQIRTRALSGKRLPLALGTVLVAALIPVILPVANVGFFTAFAVGLVANALILAVLLGGWAVLRRFRH